MNISHIFRLLSIEDAIKTGSHHEIVMGSPNTSELTQVMFYLFRLSLPFEGITIREEYIWYRDMTEQFLRQFMACGDEPASVQDKILALLYDFFLGPKELTATVIADCYKVIFVLNQRCFVIHA